MHAKVDWFKEQRNPFFCNLIVILINVVFTSAGRNCQMTFILKL
jgi:hypothetical protein